MTIQFWKVKTLREVNTLVSLGWMFEKTITVSEKEYKEHWFSIDTIYHSETHYLMSCPKGIEPQKESWESVYDYEKRMKIIEEARRKKVE